MGKNIEMYQSLDDLLWAFSLDCFPPTAPEFVTDEMKHSDRYAVFSDEGAFYNPAFCEICDIMQIDINFNKIWHLNKSGIIAVFHSRNNSETFAVFDLCCDETDQMDMVGFAVYCNDSDFDRLNSLFDIINENSWIESKKLMNSELVPAVFARNGDYTTYHKKIRKIIDF